MNKSIKFDKISKQRMKTVEFRDWTHRLNNFTSRLADVPVV